MLKEAQESENNKETFGAGEEPAVVIQADVPAVEALSPTQEKAHEKEQKPHTPVKEPLTSSVSSVSSKYVKEKEKEKERGSVEEREREREKRGKGRGKVSPLVKNQKAGTFPKNLGNIQDWKQAVVNVSSELSGLDDEVLDTVDTAANGIGTRVLRRTKKGKTRADQKQHVFEKPTRPVVREVLVPETLTIAELAQKMSVKSAEVLKTLMKMGWMMTINQPIDQATAALVIEEMGHVAKLQKEVTVEDTLSFTTTEALLPRSPVVTVMGHVDHGKTSLLDYIRTSRVAASEQGGITQHIGAYHVKTARGEITFLDTPGHAAFSSMRARGAQCTDIVILVVAGDDGVMPQTIEAIQHAKAAKVPIIVAVNKVDKPEFDLERIYHDLTQQDLAPEQWGGETQYVSVSAKTGAGVDALLEAVLLQAEILELRAPVKGPAQGVIVEASLDKGRGPMATVLIQGGTLKQGDILLAGQAYGRVRSLIDDRGTTVKAMGPSMPVVVLGLSTVPSAGDACCVVSDERKAREIALYRQNKQKEVTLAKRLVSADASIEGLFDRFQQEGATKVLPIVLKTDVQGSLEALVDALEKISAHDARVKIIGRGVGGINESDVALAMASQAILIGFNVRADASARRLSEKEAIPLYYYGVIYDVLDKVKQVLSGLLSPEVKETILGLAEVREVFRSSKWGTIAGCMVLDGVIKRAGLVRVLRNQVVTYEGEIGSLRRFKDEAAEVRNGMECGIAIKGFNDVKVGDQIELYERTEVTRTIE